MKTPQEQPKSLMNQPLSQVCNTLFMSLCKPFNSREVTVAASTPEQKLDYYKYEQVGSSGLSLHAENFLRGNLILDTLERDPGRILETVNEFYKISGEAVYLLIAADICRYFSQKAIPEERIRFHLAAFRYCCLAFAKGKEKNGEHFSQLNNSFFLQELQIFNQAVAGIFSYLKSKALLDSEKFSLFGVNGVEYRFEKPFFLLSVPREAVVDFSLCSDFDVKALRLINRHSGIGVPLVAKISSEQLTRSLRTPDGMTIPVTLFFRIKVHSPEKVSLYPYYQDTYVSETFQVKEKCIGQGFWDLARDFSTPLACFMNSITQRNLLAGMLHPVQYEQYSGLFMVEPYRPEKIPVVFIHGLMSSPETWGQMINSLKYDPTIRQKYQFWFYSYSTGIPVPYSALNLYEALKNAQKEFCTSPEATRNFDKMILVGHSMGGLVTKMLLQKKPFGMIEKLTGKKAEEILPALLPEEQELICRIFPQNALTFVKRAVFMAVPHRGSAVAQKQIAKLGIRLIKLPRHILEHKRKIERIVKILLPGEKAQWRQDSFITGIDNLNPKGYFVRWSADLPLRSDVVYHSIIGNRSGADKTGGSDGIVPYSSSHLDGVASECIVQSDHSVHRSPAAIRELLRILLLHLQENKETE